MHLLAATLDTHISPKSELVTTICPHRIAIIVTFVVKHDNVNCSTGRARIASCATVDSSVTYWCPVLVSRIVTTRTDTCPSCTFFCSDPNVEKYSVPPGLSSVLALSIVWRLYRKSKYRVWFGQMECGNSMRFVCVVLAQCQSIDDLFDGRGLRGFYLLPNLLSRTSNQSELG